VIEEDYVILILRHHLLECGPCLLKCTEKDFQGNNIDQQSSQFMPLTVIPCDDDDDDDDDDASQGGLGTHLSV